MIEMLFLIWRMICKMSDESKAGGITGAIVIVYYILKAIFFWNTRTGFIYVWQEFFLLLIATGIVIGIIIIGIKCSRIPENRYLVYNFTHNPSFLNLSI